MARDLLERRVDYVETFVDNLVAHPFLQLARITLEPLYPTRVALKVPRKKRSLRTRALTVAVPMDLAKVAGYAYGCYHLFQYAYQ